MNNVGKYLLIVGLVILALLVGVVIGRRMGAPASPLSTNDAGVQITTNSTTAAMPAPQPLPAPVQTPAPVTSAAPAASVTPPSPSQQVQDDAAAVGMTTREDPSSSTRRARPATPAPAPSTAAPATAPSGGDAATPSDGGTADGSQP